MGLAMRILVLLPLAFALVLGVQNEEPKKVDDAQELKIQLSEARANVAKIKQNVQSAREKVASAAAAAKTAKADADRTAKEAEAAKAETQKHMEAARKAVQEASANARANDIKREQEETALAAEMKADELQCGDR